jgi:hypothetical protein
MHAGRNTRNWWIKKLGTKSADIFTVQQQPLVPSVGILKDIMKKRLSQSANARVGLYSSPNTKRNMRLLSTAKSLLHQRQFWTI